MVSLFTSAYNAYNTYSNDSTPVKVKAIVAEMEKNLQNLPKKERMAQIKQIAAIKGAAKTENVSLSAVNVGLQGVNTLFGMAGPTGSAIGKFITHPYEQAIVNKGQERIGKAEKIAGRRMNRNIHNKKPQETSAVTAAAKTGLTSLAVNLSGVAGLASSAFSYLKSFVLG